MNQNRPKCHFVWWKQFFNWCQLFPLSISWMGPSGGQGARKTERSLPVFQSSYFATAYKLQFCSSNSSFSHTEALKARSQPLLIIVRQLNHYFHLSAGFEVVAEFWRMPAKSAQRYKTCTAADSAFLCLHLVLLLSGISQICPNTTRNKNMGLFWLEIPKHSSVRTHDPFLSTPKWQKLSLLVFEMKTGFSFRSK